jgi:hypothetical protein
MALDGKPGDMQPTDGGSRLVKWVVGFFLLAGLVVGAVSIYYFRFVERPLSSPWLTPAGNELVLVRAQHFYVALPISRCLKGVDLTSTGNIPGPVGAAFMLDLQPNGEIQWNPAGPTPELALNNYQNSVLYLSDAISRARMQVANVTGDSKEKMVMYQWTLIVIGAITTILISIKSMSNERTPVYLTIGILAIIFSALGTACSSIIAFDSPVETYSRNERALLQLRQLHTDLAAEVVSANDPCKPMDINKPDDSKVKRLKDFSARLTGILNASSGAGGSSAPGAPSGPGTNPPPRPPG